MAWVAAYAGWSSLVGLIVAAATGDRPRTLSVGASVAFTVIGPIVPTLVALWFNDWARDGFPAREQRSSTRGTEAPVRPTSETENPPEFPVAPLVRDR